ncbi:MAG: S1/P1 nuclease [Gemmatimonadales bacterium]
MRTLLRPALLAALTLAVIHPGLSATDRNSEARRWGIMGHRIVARIAEGRLTPATAAEVARLLDGAGIPSVANWADSFRTKHPETGVWHYVDIPTWEKSYDSVRDCKDGGCVVAALNTKIAILSDKHRSKEERGEALRFVVHFIGDMHQPLHAGERADKGGNDVKLTFEGRATNLHSVWDSGMLTASGESEDALVGRINERLATRGDLRIIAAGSIIDWAMESHDVARDVVYNFVPPSLVLDASYRAAVRPVLEDRLLRGGVRLAAVLNRALGQ